jgi:hypothetical protein
MKEEYDFYDMEYERNSDEEDDDFEEIPEAD